MTCNFTEKISSLIDGELATAEAREVERHLIGCNECQEVRADFLNLRSQLSGFETSLAPAVQSRALKKILSTPRRTPARGFAWGFGTRFGTQAAAFATLVIVAAIIGFLIYKSSNTPSNEKHIAVQQTPTPVPTATVEQKQPEPEASPNKGNEQTAPRRPPSPAPKKPLVREPKPGEQFAAIPATPEPFRSADAQTMTALHFEKSETLLVAFRNVRLNEPGSATEVTYERQRAKQLVIQNMMLRRQADAAGDVQISSLLESLEPILIDISNLPDKPDKDAVRVIRQRVERKNIVPLLRVNSTALARALD